MRNEKFSIKGFQDPLGLQQLQIWIAKLEEFGEFVVKEEIL